MDRLQTLRANAAETVAKMEALSQAAASQPMTDEQKKEFDALAKQHDAYIEDIQREEKLAAMRRPASPTGAGADPDVAAAAAAARAGGVRMGKDLAEEDPTGGFRSVGDFARAVQSAFTPGARIDARLTRGIFAAPGNFHQEGGGAAGEGYVTPAQHRNTIFELAFPGNDLVSAVDPEPSDSNAIDIERDETTPWGATGVQAKWRNEVTQMTASKSKTDLDTVRLQELYAFVTAGEELLSDAPRLQNRLTNKSAQAIRYKASDALMNGTGAGQPLGWMKSLALVTVAKESGQAAQTITAMNVLKMFSRLILEGGGNPFWAAHSTTLPQIATMTIGNQPIWTPPTSGLKEAPGGRLLGLPIHYLEQAETLGAKGDLQLINPVGYYAAVKRGEGVQFASSVHLYFDYGLQAFRWMFRLGGQPYLSAPIARAKGSETKSHFICLEPRQ